MLKKLILNFTSLDPDYPQLYNSLIRNSESMAEIFFTLHHRRGLPSQFTNTKMEIKKKLKKNNWDPTILDRPNRNSQQTDIFNKDKSSEYNAYHCLVHCIVSFHYPRHHSPSLPARYHEHCTDILLPSNNLRADDNYLYYAERRYHKIE